MCGLLHSTLVTTPVTLTGFVESYSAANEWCAKASVGAAMKPAISRLATVFFMFALLYFFRPASQFVTTVMGEGVLSPAGTVNRNFWPSDVTSMEFADGALKSFCGTPAWNAFPVVT